MRITTTCLVKNTGRYLGNKKRGVCYVPTEINNIVLIQVDKRIFLFGVRNIGIVLYCDW